MLRSSYTWYKYYFPLNATFFWFLGLVFRLKYKALWIKYKAWRSLRACTNSGPEKSQPLNIRLLGDCMCLSIEEHPQVLDLLLSWQRSRLKTLGHWNFPPTAAPCQNTYLRGKIYPQNFTFFSTYSSGLGKKHIPGHRLSDKFRTCIQW